MSDERSAVDRRDNSAVYAALEALRSDVREDIGHLRDDVREDLSATEARLMASLTEYTIRHGADHDAQRLSSETAHARFEAFIRAAELAQARRDGALGVFRFVLEQLARHWKPITAIVTSLTAAAAVVSGSIQIEVIAR